MNALFSTSSNLHNKHYITMNANKISSCKEKSTLVVGCASEFRNVVNAILKKNNIVAKLIEFNSKDFSWSMRSDCNIIITKWTSEFNREVAEIRKEINTNIIAVNPFSKNIMIINRSDPNLRSNQHLSATTFEAAILKILKRKKAPDKRDSNRRIIFENFLKELAGFKLNEALTILKKEEAGAKESEFMTNLLNALKDLINSKNEKGTEEYSKKIRSMRTLLNNAIEKRFGGKDVRNFAAAIEALNSKLSESVQPLDKIKLVTYRELINFYNQTKAGSNDKSLEATAEGCEQDLKKLSGLDRKKKYNFRGIINKILSDVNDIDTLLLCIYLFCRRGIVRLRQAKIKKSDVVDSKRLSDQAFRCFDTGASEIIELAQKYLQTQDKGKYREKLQVLKGFINNTLIQDANNPRRTYQGPQGYTGQKSIFGEDDEQAHIDYSTYR